MWQQLQKQQRAIQGTSEENAANIGHVHPYRNIHMIF